MIQELKYNYRHLFEEDLLNEISQVGTFKEVPAGFTMMAIGDYVRGMPLLVFGAIKVIREDKEGDELLLYYLESGETCSMTMNCCMGQTKSQIKAVAEQDTKLIIVPIQKMEEWIATYKTWRDFVFLSYHTRLNEVLHILDSVAFEKMDQRLVNYLKEKIRINKSNTIHNTHQEIAYELHSSRVVISRLLKKLEQLGCIELHRNHIKIINLA
ncbi:Crp/Fnr family transcriptional regulator [Kordia sp.]|uniref:Crp/Fnr family transcriptional regulator n=1 Tax=Kordia sp. TaxID=1965332 RepID=UPI0025C2DB67|nr:Crp/Fnr family transcriptional regulator [Kordia sp.]MCH2195527.1 Crp/Fnr family transcriptional regulator [Kordia sp.]